LLLLVSACGVPLSSEVPVGHGASVPLALEQLVPTRAPYVWVVPRLEQLADLLGKFADALPAEVRERVARELRQELGPELVGAFVPGELAAAGFAVDRPLAVYSTGVFPTLLVPVADPARVEAFLRGVLRHVTVGVTEVEGHALNVYRMFRGGPMVAFAIVDGWLHVTFNSEELQTPAAWLRQSTHAVRQPSARLTQLLAQAGPDVALAGDWDVQAFEDSAGELLGALQLDDEPSCAQFRQQARALIESASFRVRLIDKGVAGEVSVRLSPAAHAALRQHVGPDVDARVRAASQRAWARATLALDLDWLAAVAQPLRDARCGMIWRLVHELEPWSWRDPAHAFAGVTMFQSYHLALLGMSPHPAALAGLALRSGGPLATVLGTLAPTLTGRTRTVAGQRVSTLDLADYGVPVEVDWLVDQQQVLAALGAGSIERLLRARASRPSPASRPEKPLFAVDLFPARVPDLSALMDTVGVPGYLSVPLVALLSRFAWLGGAVNLDQTGIRVTAGFQLR